MQVWHLTPDAGRDPHRVTPGIPVRLRIGTWPVEPGQQVHVEFRVVSWGGVATTGHVPARWVENRGGNSYWQAGLGPFRDGDRIAYRIAGSVGGAAVATDELTFVVGPVIHLALLWHQHQPLYRDLTAPPMGGYRFPWVRLHALRDYFGMAHLVAQHPGLRLTMNFSPVLLWQLDEYAWGQGADRALVLTRTPTARLRDANRRELIETFFDADWHHQIYPHARYRELFEKRFRNERFSDQDVTDLQMWFNLAWFGVELRTGQVPLPDGRSASVQRFVEQGRGFAQSDIEAMLAEQLKILENIVPLHRQLQELGQIEVSVSPYAHPIAPLLVDTDRATVDRPGASLPRRFAHPEDLEAQVAGAVAFYRDRFGRPPSGMWPAEGAVARWLVPLFARHGVRWIASDEGVLARSGRHGYRVDDPGVLCQPYQALEKGGEGTVSVLFRSRGLSDAIGFEYGRRPDHEVAAGDFLASVKALGAGLKGDRDHLVTVILDGENAWGGYRDDGRPFLHALYRRLASDEEVKTVTVSEYLDGNRARRLPAHPATEQTRVYELFTGSWIDEWDSAPGADLGTWIGEPEENAAWELLGAVRASLEQTGRTPESHPDAFRAFYGAEGSDWFWWFGADHQSDADEAFDDLFRAHLRAVCRLAEIEAPPGLDRHIVPHRVLWTFSAPVDAIQAGDELIIRTNCPGNLAWSIDGWATAREAAMHPVGGVMAGAARYAVTLGPFSAGTAVRFRFRCRHPDCDGDSPCCQGEERVVTVAGVN
jgi:alpha-amylase/alpha-mannosidase (GH57 family)